MGYFSKEGNIITIRKEGKASTITSLIFGSLFWIPFGLAGWVLLYALLFNDMYSEETNEKMGVTGKMIFFVFMDIPFLFVSYFIFTGYYSTIKGLIYPKILFIDIENKKIDYHNSLPKKIHQFNFDNFEKIEYSMITIDRGDNDTDYHLKSCIEGKDVILYLTDRLGIFDPLDIKFISNYLGIPITKSKTEMEFKDYNEFRKKELDDRKLEKRKVFFL